MKNLNISQLALDTKKMTFDYPGLEGFKVTLTHLSKPEQVKIREASTVSKVDQETGFPYTELDQDLYIRNFATRAINGWEGLTGEHLAKIMLIDESQLEDPKETIDYSVDNAVSMLRYSKAFDNWVTAQLGKIDNFRG